MQLKTTGESLKALNIIQSITSTTALTESEKYHKLTEALSKYSLETLKATLAKEQLSKKLIKSILSEKGYQGELLNTTVDELANIASTNALSASQGHSAATTLGLGAAFKGLGASIKSAGAAMKAFILTNPLAPLIAAAGITAGIIKLCDLISVTPEKKAEALAKQKDKLNDVAESYSNIASELTDLEKEIQNNLDAIHELENTPNLSWVEQEELEYLREATKELQLQKALKEEKQLQAAEDLYDENKATFEQEFESSYGNSSVSDLKQRLMSGNISLAQLDLTGNITDMIAAMQYLNEKKGELSDPEEIADYDSLIHKISQKASGYLSSISSYKQNILEIAGLRDLTEDEQEFYDYLKYLQKSIYEFYSPATWNTIQFDSILDTKGIELTKEQLIQLSQAGKLDEETLEGYPKLYDAIKNSQLICKEGQNAFEAFSNEIASLADEKPSDIEILSFSQVFNSDEFREAKQSLLDLSSAGELTAETLSSTEVNLTEIIAERSECCTITAF